MIRTILIVAAMIIATTMAVACAQTIKGVDHMTVITGKTYVVTTDGTSASSKIEVGKRYTIVERYNGATRPIAIIGITKASGSKAWFMVISVIN